MGNTFIINRLDLNRMLALNGISEKSLHEIESVLDKTHRHVNAVTFAGMLQKLGLKLSQITNILRRIGIDDITITNILNALDEEKISASLGKSVLLNVE